jgi:hypothetical protein
MAMYYVCAADTKDTFVESELLSAAVKIFFKEGRSAGRG